MYDFDKVVDRKDTAAMKLEGYKSYIFGESTNIELPYKEEDLIQMWIADMEFETAPEILNGIRKRLDRKILGYTTKKDKNLYNAIKSWCKRKYDWDINEEELLISDGVIPAIEKIMSVVLGENEKVLINTPAYGQFAKCAERVHRKFITSDLIYDNNGEYKIDFYDLDKKMSMEDVKMFVFCSPHNPTGKVWSVEELEKVANLVRKHNIFMISDEIHCDVRRAKAPQHIPFKKILQDYDKLAICMSTSKTFNLAGLQQSAIFITNEKIRQIWRNEEVLFLNPLSLAGTIAAFNEGDQWLDSLTKYLDDNFEFTKKFINKKLPYAIMSESEATYLGWLDLKYYFDDDEDIELFFAVKAGVLIESDKSFTSNAKGMIRLNLACPRKYLEIGLERICKALNNKNEKFTLKR